MIPTYDLNLLAALDMLLTESSVRAEFDLYESVGGTQAGIFVIHHDDRRGGRRSCRKLCPLIFAAVFWLLFREARATVLLRRDLV